MMEIELDKDGRIKALKVIDIKTYSVLNMSCVLKMKFADSSGNPHVLQFDLSQDQTATLASRLASHALVVGTTTPTDPQ